MLQVEDQPAKAVRVFVGLKIAQDVAEALAHRARLIESPPSRFVPCQDIHLTLLPPWDETCIPEAIERLRAALSGLKPFTLAFTRLSYWPSLDRPRLLCTECLPTDELQTLQQALLNAFGRKNDKPFQPHVTLARMQRAGRAAAGKNQMDRELPLIQSIDSVELFQSRTQAGKGYQILASLPLVAPRRKWRDLLRQSLIRITGLWGQLAHPGKAEKAARSKGRSQIEIGTPSRSGASKCCNS
jgi:RNA 2',3'-cyclic 3'-phosphodiesterase